MPLSAPPRGSDARMCPVPGAAQKFSRGPPAACVTQTRPLATQTLIAFVAFQFSENGSCASVTTFSRPTPPPIPPDTEYHRSDPVTPPIPGAATALAGGVDRISAPVTGSRRSIRTPEPPYAVLTTSSVPAASLPTSELSECGRRTTLLIAPVVSETRISWPAPASHRAPPATARLPGPGPGGPSRTRLITARVAGFSRSTSEPVVTHNDPSAASAWPNPSVSTDAVILPLAGSILASTSPVACPWLVASQLT